MTRIVAGGTGYIGRYIVNRWLQQGHKLTVISRSKSQVEKVFSAKVNAVTWEELQQQGSALIQQSDFILNLAGASVGSKRWTGSQKEILLKSRTDTSAILSKICAQLGNKAPALFNASAIGIYGLQSNEKQLPPCFTEATEIDFAAPHNFLATIACDWEQATAVAKTHGVRVLNLRFGIVLGEKAPILQQLCLPFQFGLGGTIGQGTQAFSWVHIEDLVKAIEYLFSHQTINGPVNIVSPHCIMQQELAKALGKILKRPSFMRTPGRLIKLILGTEMANELVLYGQHVYPQRLLELGYPFQYPHIATALKQIFSR